MATKLERIAQLSKENPNMVFTSIGHLINKDMLMDCHRKMDGNKAVGIDGVTKEEYCRIAHYFPKVSAFLSELNAGDFRVDNWQKCLRLVQPQASSRSECG